VEDAQDEDVFVLNAIEDDVVAYGKAAEAGTEIFVAGATDVRVGGEQENAATMESMRLSAAS
jgi:hypothetical protein